MVVSEKKHAQMQRWACANSKTVEHVRWDLGFLPILFSNVSDMTLLFLKIFGKENKNND